MIPKRGNRFSDRIMLIEKNEGSILIEPASSL